MSLFTRPIEKKPLWPHQERAVEDLKLAFRDGSSRIVLMMATGGGKTRLSAEIINRALAKGKRVAFTVPRLTLVDQAVEAFMSEGIRDLGVMQGLHFMTDATAPVQVISAQTLARRQRPAVDIVIVDEAHEQHRSILQWMNESPDILFIGLSATPWARGMGKYWSTLLTVATASDLIEQKVLVPPVVYAPAIPDLSGISIRKGDYAEGELADRMSSKEIVGDVVLEWKKSGQGRPTLVFAVNRNHAKHLQGCFNDGGIPAAYIDANTPQSQRAEIFEGLKDGTYKAICNIEVLTAGVDLPFVGCICDVRPTRSLIRYVQSIGRGLRSAPGKENCIVLDHAGNALRLGLVTDIICKNLDKSDKATASKESDIKDRTPLPRLCDECKFVMPVRSEKCPQCGHINYVKTNIIARDGELIHIGSTKSGRHEFSYFDKGAFFAELKWLAAERGYKPTFPVAVFKERFKQWPDSVIKSFEPREPTRETINWVRHRRIAFSKSRRRTHG